MKPAHIKKLIAPVLITVLLIAILLVWLIGYMALLPGILPKIGVFVLLAALVGVSVFVLVERIREVKGGEEDDLSQY